MQKKQNGCVCTLHKHNSAHKKGFSMVELVAVIGVLAVLLVVLIPSLLAHTERSRSQKDASAADEMVHAVLLAISDERVYDDIIAKSIDNNVACYIDGPTESSYTKVVTKTGSGGSTEQYTFNESARVEDEVPYYLAGSMYGVTITFEPINNGDAQCYLLQESVVNKFIKSSRTHTLGRDCAYLYSALRQAFGDQMELTSQTYKNSEFTIFIRLGNTNGAIQDSIDVYGQFSGTNLTSSDTLYYIASDRGAGDPGPITPVVPGPGNDGSVDQELLVGDGIFVSPDKGIPAGGCYYSCVSSMGLGDYSGATATYSIGEELPTLSNGDVFVYGDYEYRYNHYYHENGWYFDANQNGWGVRTLSREKLYYKPIITSINGGVVNTLMCTFYDCQEMLTAPTIPNTIVNMRSTFNRCYKLYKAPEIPVGVTNMRAAFRYCGELSEIPTIPSNVRDMYLTFEDCKNLSGIIRINANPTVLCTLCFSGTSKEIYLTGDSIMLKELAATDGYEDLSVNDNVRVLGSNPGTNVSRVVPEGGVYYVGVGETLHGDCSSATEVVVAGRPFPDETKDGDAYVFGDYEYRYNYYWNPSSNKWVKIHRGALDGWRVRVRKTDQVSYGEILSSINNKNVTSMDRTFMNCRSMNRSPQIPGSVITLRETYKSCLQLRSSPLIGKEVTDLKCTFQGCKNLTGLIEINTDTDNHDNCFYGTSKEIYLTGISTKLESIAATDGYTDMSNMDNVRVLANDKSSAQYTVNHWWQNLDGDATLLDSSNYTMHEVEKMVGIVGENVTPSVMSYTGFIAPSTKTVVVSDNGRLTVNYYYTRRMYYIDVNVQVDDTFYTSISYNKAPVLFTITVNDKVVAKNVADHYVKYPYGSTYSIDVFVKGGYYWDGKLRNGKANGTVLGTVSYAPIVKSNTESQYVVNHWLQNLDGDPNQKDENNYTKVDSTTTIALIGTNVSPNTNSYTGFVAPPRCGVIVNEYGTSEINYYYERAEYYLDLNTLIDGVTCNNSSTNVACTFKVTINGNVVANGVADFYRTIPYGSTYSIEVTMKPGYKWDGTLNRGSAPLSGTITGRMSFCPVIVSD